MEEIRIYRSIWKNAIFIYGFILIAWLVFLNIAILNISGPKEFYENLINHFVSTFGTFWGSFLFVSSGLSVLGFVCFYLRWTYRLLKEQINHIPYYTITDRGFIMEHNNMEILFADVEEFFINKDGKNKWIEIQYKNGVNLLKYERTDFFVRIFRPFFKNYDWTLKTIYADGLTISTQNLCELLNERLATAYNKKKPTNHLK